MSDHEPKKLSESEIKKQEKTSVCVSMNVADHKRLKIYAASIGKTVSGVIKDWVDQYCVQKEENNGVNE